MTPAITQEAATRLIGSSFAFLPTRLDDGSRIWWQPYWEARIPLPTGEFVLRHRTRAALEAEFVGWPSEDDARQKERDA